MKFLIQSTHGERVTNPARCAVMSQVRHCVF